MRASTHLALLGALALGLLAPAARAEFTFAMEAGGAVVTGYVGTEAELAVPETFNGSPVIRVGYQAFRALPGVTRISLPKTVAALGGEAFDLCPALAAIEVDPENPNLKSVDGVLLSRDGALLFRHPEGKGGAYAIPDGVETVGYAAFYRCSQVTSVSFPSSVANIQDGAFQECVGLRQMTLPPGIPSVAAYLFFGCANLEEVSIPSSATLIGYGAFAGCAKLESIAIPAGVAEIQSSAFFRCAKLSSVALPESALTLGDSLFEECLSLESVQLPSQLTSLPNAMFHTCPQLGMVALPATLTHIGDWSFYDCAKLSGLTLPAGLKSIGLGAFMNCSGLQAMELPESITSIGGHAFRDCWGLTSIRLPSGLTSLGEYTFNNCFSLREVALPAGLAAIGTAAFGYCYDLESITLPASLKTLGNEAFFDCQGLEAIVVPEGVESVGAFAFAYCLNLGSVSLPDSLASLGEGCFYYGANLEEIAIPAGVGEIGPGAFNSCQKLRAIEVAPANSAFSSVDGVLYNKAGTVLVRHPAGKEGEFAIPPAVTRLAPDAFREAQSLRAVTLPPGMAEIGREAFYGCYSLLGISIPASVTLIGPGALNYCAQLGAINVDPLNPAYRAQDGVLFDKADNSLLQYPGGKLGAYAIPAGTSLLHPRSFAGSYSLTRASLPDSLVTVGESAFQSCENLRSVSFGAGVAEFGQQAFAWSGLREITIPPGVTNLAPGLLRNCPDLARVTLHGGVARIGSYAFAWTASLRELSLPQGVERVDDLAFEGAGLANIMLPPTLTHLGARVFMSCAHLDGLFFRGAPPEFGDGLLTDSPGAKPRPLAGAAGWGAAFAGRPTLEWTLRVPVSEPRFGLEDGKFGFTIVGVPGLQAVVEASDNPGVDPWTEVGRGTLAGGSAHVSDPASPQHPARAYRVRSL